MTSDELTAIIVEAKAATYVGGDTSVPASRSGACDRCWERGGWRYRHSCFGGTDVLGQEVVWHAGEPIWAMNYHGHIRRSDLIDGDRARATIKAALAALYREGRFLGGFDWTGPHGRYRDRSAGATARFRGRQIILVDGIEAYALDYFGGLVRA